jgi:hypothetical protein
MRLRKHLKNLELGSGAYLQSQLLRHFKVMVKWNGIECVLKELRAVPGGTHVIPPHWRLRKEDPEFEASLGYIARQCLKMREKKKNLNFFQEKLNCMIS